MTTKGLTDLQRAFLKARDVSVPLVALRTPDPGAAIEALQSVVVTDKDQPGPVVRWDCVRGVAAMNRSWEPVARALGGANAVNPVEVMMKAETGLPAYGALFMMGLGELLNQSGAYDIRQAFWNLRTPLKGQHRTIVAMMPFGGVPLQLEHDVLLLDDPLPAVEELGMIVKQQFANAKLAVPATDVVSRATDALSGLAAFEAENAVALSLCASGMDWTALRARHRTMIEATKGLTVWQGGETFAQVGGLRQFIRFMRQFLGAGVYRPGAVIMIDEVEKCLAGVKGDLTGISQDYLAVLLSYMQDGQVPGILLCGHPGTGKSLLVKATGGEAGVPLVRLDLGAMQGSLVGESQAAIRHALKVCTAVSQGRPLIIATANSVAVLPPELINRFKWRFFVDLPDAEEKATIWPVHLAKRGLDVKQVRPDDTDWNGREVEQCTETAKQLKVSLIEASQYVVPIAQSSAEAIELRRREATGRYLSASKPGVYGHEVQETVTVGTRQIRLPEAGWVAPGSGKAN